MEVAHSLQGTPGIELGKDMASASFSRKADVAALPGYLQLQSAVKDISFGPRIIREVIFLDSFAISRLHLHM